LAFLYARRLESSSKSTLPWLNSLFAIDLLEIDENRSKLKKNLFETKIDMKNNLEKTIDIDLYDEDERARARES